MTDKLVTKYVKQTIDWTFFFCLPPPDFAGLDDGGGAFSFFGACNTQQQPMFVRPKKRKIQKDSTMLYEVIEGNGCRPSKQ